MLSLGSNKTGVGVIFLLCLVLESTAMYDASSSDMDQVKDVDREIANFMFDCTEQPWIRPCYNVRRYLMLFDSKGNYLKESFNKTDETKSYLSASISKKAFKPGGKEILEGKGYPPFLFQLERKDYISGYFYIATSSGKLLVAGNENLSPSLELKEDHCTTVASMAPYGRISNANLSQIALRKEYTCEDQALWTLWKVDERFLVIQSVHKEGFFLFVAVEDRKVTLNGGMPEKLTGIKTSFLSDQYARSDGKYITLERTDGEAEPEIGREDYGDVVIHYFDRDGIEKKGYICDYEWGMEDANSVCRHLGHDTGMPTYDGRYSKTITPGPEYAVSGMSCDTEDFETCKFRTICGTSNPSCLIQLSMKQFKGKGHACNKGSETDVAGVICGNQTQINNILKEKITCNRGTIQKDNKSVARIFSIQKQIKKVGSKMFKNQHWSEYLLPLPMAISLMSTLLLVSSQFNRDVELYRPNSGKWKHLEFDYLQPNLLLLSQNVKNNLMLSNANMGVIKVNSQTIHENMKDSVSYAFSSDKYENEVLLNRSLRYIAEDAQTNKEKAEEVSDAFKVTGEIIEELLKALKNSDAKQGNINADLTHAIKMVNDKNEKDREKLVEEKKKKQEYDEKVEKSRKEFFDAATSAMKAQCVDEVTECSNCQYQEAKKTDQCKPGSLIRECTKYQQNCIKEMSFCAQYDSKACSKMDTYCAEHEEGCAKYEDLCTGGFETKCVKDKEVCADWFGCCICQNYYTECTEHSTDCQGWTSQCVKKETVCKRKESKCASFKTECIKKEQMCIKYENECIEKRDICTDPIYYPKVNGNYCQDDGMKKKLCSKCKWIGEVSKTLQNVANINMQIQMDVLNDQGSSYSGVTNIAEDLVATMDLFYQDVQNYKKWKQSNEISRIPVIVPTISNVTSDIVNDTKVNYTKIDNLDAKTNITYASSDIVNDTKIDNLDAKANINIRQQLKIMKLKFIMNFDTLSEVNIPIAKNVREYLVQLKAFITDLIEKKIETVHQMTDSDKTKVTTLLTIGKTLHKKAEELQEKNEISFEPGVATADHKTGKQAEAHLENLTKRHKTEKNIESLANKMRNSLREILEKEIQSQDVQATIKYLRECFKHLNFLQAQWDSLKIFFQKLVDFLELMEKDINRMKDFYMDIGVMIPGAEISNSLKKNLQTKISENLASNMYVKKIAYFYTKIAEDGLLKTMGEIGNNLQYINNPQALKRYKNFIEDEAKMTQDRIMKYVSKEEAKLNDKITEEVSSIKNVLACKLEGKEISRAIVKSFANILSAENVEKNVKVIAETASEDEIKDMHLLRDVQLEINKVDVNFEDEEDYEDYGDH